MADDDYRPDQDKTPRILEFVAKRKRDARFSKGDRLYDPLLGCLVLLLSDECRRGLEMEERYLQALEQISAGTGAKVVFQSLGTAGALTTPDDIREGFLMRRRLIDIFEQMRALIEENPDDVNERLEHIATTDLQDVFRRVSLEEAPEPGQSS